MLLVFFYKKRNQKSKRYKVRKTKHACIHATDNIANHKLVLMTDAVINNAL
jgi:hypothetical protein